MSVFGRPDGVSFLIEPPEALRDAPIEQIRRALAAERHKIMEQIAQTIHREFTSRPRMVGSIQEAAHENEMAAALQHRRRLDGLADPIPE